MKKTNKNKHILDLVKAAKKHSREEEIKLYGKPVNHLKVVKSKKIYDRKNLRRNDSD